MEAGMEGKSEAKKHRKFKKKPKLLKTLQDQVQFCNKINQLTFSRQSSLLFLLAGVLLWRFQFTQGQILAKENPGAPRRL